MDNGSKESIQLLAHLFIQHGKPEKARTLLEGLQELFPEDEFNARALASLYHSKGLYQEALGQIRLWERLANEPSAEHTRVALLIRAGALKELGETDKAQAAIESFMALNTDNTTLKSTAEG